MPAIFVSHSSRDNKVSHDIKTWLGTLGFERVFLDFDDVSGLYPGDDWEKRLYSEIARSHAVILVLTPNWVASKWCFAELTQARALGKVVIPVICAPIGEHKILPEIQSVDLIDWNAGLAASSGLLPNADDPCIGLERVKQRLHAITDEIARGFTLPSNRPPYPGIHAFEVEDAAIYFGRDEEIRVVIEKLDARRALGGARLLLIVGASGAGKSSLLKAGILPQLGRRQRQWITLPPMRPERAPVESLAKTIAQYVGTAGAWEEWHQKLKTPAEGINEIAKLAQSLRIGQSAAATLLIPIDQFEEIFTVSEASERTQFLALLAAALDLNLGLPLMVIATGRADVLQGLLEGSVLAALTELVSLLPIPLDRVPRLIEGPAAVAGLAVEKGLAEQIVRDVQNPEALPLLAYTLWLLHARSAEDKRLTLAAYYALGDATCKLNPVQNAVRRAADEAITGINPNEQELAALRDAFVPHLVRLRLDDAKRVRQSARISDLPREADRLLHVLTEARLLSARTQDQSQEKGGGEAVIEVTHEALFEAWPTLREWLNEEQDFLADIARLKAAHETWERAREVDEALLQGLLLNRATEWLTRYPRRFGSGSMKAVGTFIEKSAAAENAKQATARRLKMRLLQMAVLISVLVLGIGAGLAWSNRNYLKKRTVMLVESIWSPVLAPAAERILKSGQTFKECADCPQMVVIEPGEFLMGSPDTEEGRYSNEGPQHTVRISTPFAVSRFEVTFEEWDACYLLGGCALRPWDQDWGRGLRPVIFVSWSDAQEYVNWLAKRTGKAYRLLSEAEWEYAARARSSKAFSWGDHIPEGSANCNGCGSRWDFDRTAPVNFFRQMGLV